MKSSFVSLALAGLLLTALVGCGPGKLDQSSASSTPVVSQNQPTPNGLFSGLDTVDMEGNPVDRSVFGEHTLTLVNVWNLGCTPCIEEMPTLERLDQEYEEQSVAVLGLYYSRKPELSEMGRNEVLDLLDKYNVRYPHLQPNQSMADSPELQNLVGFPTSYFVNAEGEILDTVIGTRSYDEWRDLIDEQLLGLGMEAAERPEGMFVSMETQDLDGAPVDSALFAEHTLTLVNVWDLDCEPCIEEMPALQRLNQAYGDRVTVRGLYLNPDRSPGFGSVTREQIKAVMDKMDVDYQQLAFSEAMLNYQEAKELMGTPTTYFVNSEGEIIQTELGTRSYDEWKELVDQLLEQEGTNE